MRKRRGGGRRRRLSHPPHSQQPCAAGTRPSPRAGALQPSQRRPCAPPMTAAATVTRGWGGRKRDTLRHQPPPPRQRPQPAPRQPPPPRGDRRSPAVTVKPSPSTPPVALVYPPPCKQPRGPQRGETPTRRDANWRTPHQGEARSAGVWPAGRQCVGAARAAGSPRRRPTRGCICHWSVVAGAGRATAPPPDSGGARQPGRCGALPSPPLPPLRRQSPDSGSGHGPRGVGEACGKPTRRLCGRCVAASFRFGSFLFFCFPTDAASSSSCGLLVAWGARANSFGALFSWMRSPPPFGQ